MATTETPAVRVERKLTISVEADAFLQRVREERNVASESEALEMLLHELIAAEELRAIDAVHTKHYDSLSDEEIEEERLGRFWRTTNGSGNHAGGRTLTTTRGLRYPLRGEVLVGQPSHRPARQG